MIGRLSQWSARDGKAASTQAVRVPDVFQLCDGASIARMASGPEAARVPSLRLIRCAHQPCGRTFLLCSRCDRGNRYCSKECAAAARAIKLVAVRRAFEQTEHARADRRARARAYRLAKKSVTDHGSHQPSHGRNLRPARLSRNNHKGRNVEDHSVQSSDPQRTNTVGARCECCGLSSNRLRRWFL